MNKRTLTLAALAIAAVLGQGTPSNAVLNLATAGPAASVAGYATPVFVIDRTASANFLNLDPQAPHNVVSFETRVVNGRHEPLFGGPLVPAGALSEITFLPNVPAGDYAFFCTAHPTMRGTVTVR